MQLIFLMMRPSLRLFLLSLFSVIFFSLDGRAKECSEALRGGQAVSSFEAWNKLRNENQLVNQNSVEAVKGDGYCASTCMVNIIQATSMMAGSTLLKDPQKKLESFIGRFHKPGQGMAPERIIKILQKSLKERLGERIEIKAQAIPKTADPSVFSSLKALTLEQMIPQPHELKLLLVTTFDQNGEMMGTHALIFQGFSRGEVDIVEPNFPNEVVRARTLSSVELNGIDVPEFIYTRKGLKGVASFVPWAVVTLALR